MLLWLWLVCGGVYSWLGLFWYIAASGTGGQWCPVLVSVASVVRPVVQWVSCPSMDSWIAASVGVLGGDFSPPGVFVSGRCGGAVAPYMLMVAMTVTNVLVMPHRGWCAWALVGCGRWRRAVMAVGLWCGACLVCLLA